MVDIDHEISTVAEAEWAIAQTSFWQPGNGHAPHYFLPTQSQEAACAHAVMYETIAISDGDPKDPAIKSVLL